MLFIFKTIRAVFSMIFRSESLNYLGNTERDPRLERLFCYAVTYHVQHNELKTLKTERMFYYEKVGFWYACCHNAGIYDSSSHERFEFQ